MDQRRRFEPEIAELVTAEEIASIIEQEVVPRLVLAHAAARPAEPLPSPRQVAFVTDLAASRAPQLQETVDALLRRGLPLEAILVGLVAPAARLAEQRWVGGEYSLEQFATAADALLELMESLLERPPRDLDR